MICLPFELFCSDLELKPHGKLTVTVVRAESLKNKELIGKSDPYVVLYIRPMFKEKTSVIDDNLNPEWNETFSLIAEDKETQHLILQVHFPSSSFDRTHGEFSFFLGGSEIVLLCRCSTRTS